MALLELKSLTKAFTPGDPAVDDVSLSIAQGEIVCLLGPSGCGKTTLLRMIAGLEIPDSGEVWFDGQNMGRVAPHLRDFGMMFQDFALFPHKNVAQNIGFGLQMHGLSAVEINARVAEMLALVALPEFGKRDISQLSGGEQQRVALARSLAPEPRLLMLDEPLGALDRALRERLMLDLRQILKQVGVTAVYVTHDQTEAFAVSDRIALMYDGHIEQVDSPKDVFYNPETEFAARFLGFRNLLPATVIDARTVRTKLGDFAVSQTLPQPGSQTTLLIRPEAASIAESGDDLPSNQLEATITDVSFRGRFTQVWLEANGQILMFELADKDLVKDTRVTVQIDPDATNILPA